MSPSMFWYYTSRQYFPASEQADVFKNPLKRLTDSREQSLASFSSREVCKPEDSRMQLCFRIIQEAAKQHTDLNS